MIKFCGANKALLIENCKRLSKSWAIIDIINFAKSNEQKVLELLNRASVDKLTSPLCTGCYVKTSKEFIDLFKFTIGGSIVGVLAITGLSFLLYKSLNNKPDESMITKKNAALTCVGSWAAASYVAHAVLCRIESRKLSLLISNRMHDFFITGYEEIVKLAKSDPSLAMSYLGNLRQQLPSLRIDSFLLADHAVIVNSNIAQIQFYQTILEQVDSDYYGRFKGLSSTTTINSIYCAIGIAAVATCMYWVLTRTGQKEERQEK